MTVLMIRGPWSKNKWTKRSSEALTKNLKDMLTDNQKHWYMFEVIGLGDTN